MLTHQIYEKTMLQKNNLREIFQIYRLIFIYSVPFEKRTNFQKTTLHLRLAIILTITGYATYIMNVGETHDFTIEYLIMVDYFRILLTISFTTFIEHDIIKFNKLFKILFEIEKLNNELHNFNIKIKLRHFKIKINFAFVFAFGSIVCWVHQDFTFFVKHLTDPIQQFEVFVCLGSYYVCLAWNFLGLVFVYGVVGIEAYQAEKFRQAVSRLKYYKKFRFAQLKWYIRALKFYIIYGLFVVSNTFGILVNMVLCSLMWIHPIANNNMILFVWIGIVSVLIFLLLLDSIQKISYQVSNNYNKIIN